MTAQGDGILARHEPAYAEWLAANPQGFVLLERTYTIHRAACPSVRPLHGPERRPSLLGGGVCCSRGVAPLEFALIQLGDFAHLCTRCKPQSDPDGVGVHAEYAAKMRAHLAEEHALINGIGVSPGES